MSTHYVPSILGASNRVPQTETAHEMFEAVCFELNPSKVGDPLAETTLLGPPTTGDRRKGELWADALCARWRCTVAGEPGTWVQIGEPIVADTTARDAIASPPTGYRVTTADTGERHLWDGAAWGVI